MESLSDLSLEQRQVIDQLADEFEAAFRAGHRPSIEKMLAANPALRLRLLTELVAIEIELRRAVGELPRVEEYKQRFPNDASVVEAVFYPATDLASTADQSRDTEVEEDEPQPERLGRYVIQRQLGRGGFGVVYLAFDPQLGRAVALKIPRRKRFKTAQQVASFIQEASTAAKLKHHALVAVHDVQEHDGLPYIVQEYIEGKNLADWAAKHRPSFESIAKVLLGVSEAIGYAHQQGLTHCDLKLANVLIDLSGQPHVADFGLAVHENTQGLRKGEVFGTPAMMAPEQVRGESHRLDGRTDIWAIGVMLYQLLVGRRPFAATNQKELFNEIQTLEPKPPRQIDRSVPRELERICLKCLSKHKSDRYNTTDDLGEDLSAWLQQADSTQVPKSSTVVTTGVAPVVTPDTSSGSKPPAKIIPKGLRSFDAGDADFFLDLLPGPRDRDGLPESIRFWKKRIEETDPDQTFSVGLMYGPSGCGKSSLVKAGLLPRLSDQVLAIYVEATGADTEVRILKQLRKHVPRLPADMSLVDACAEIRLTGAGRQRKVLLVIDQFEQWLHSHPGLKQAQLVDALRQCEGERLQAMLLVRDDFFASVHRLFQELDEPLLEGCNYALIDKFDVDHARKVLIAFGRAYGKLGENLSVNQTQFVEQAVEELTEDAKVICVRLSLFADMMKMRSWIPSSLKDVGGVGGVGETFLEETFSAKAAPPSHRVHETAIRQVLKALLPEAGTDIKGAMRSEVTLRQAAGYPTNEADRFGEVVRILDQELRIITPTEPDGERLEVGGEKLIVRTSPASHFYQLTHDYLVHSLRDWLTRKQKETRKGRAELKLFDTALTWNSKPENRFLPSLWDNLSIRWLTDKKKWNEPQRKMMRTAAKVHGLTWGGALAALLVLGLTVQYWVSQRDWNNKRDQTRIAAESLQNNLGPSIPVNIGELKKLPESLVLAELSGRFTTDNSRHKLALAFALAAYGRVETEYLVSRIDDIATVDTANFVDALALDREKRALTIIKAEAAKCMSESLWRRKAKLAIAALALGETGIAADMCQYENRSDPGQRTIFIHEFPQWEWQLPNRALDLSQLAQLVAESTDSGMRSGLSLAVGSIPKDRLQDLNPTGLESWTQLASGWFAQHGDTSTHSASSWLLRQWKLPLPKVPDETDVRADRDWFVNSAGMTMLRIKPPADEPGPGIKLANPLERFRKQLVELRDVAKEKLTQAQLRTRATAYFQTGDHAAALVDLERLLEDPKISNPGQLPVYRILALSRLGRHDDATAAYETVRATLTKQLNLYLASQMAALRGEHTTALDLIGQAAGDETLNDGELYDTACAAALCAKSLSETEPDSYQKFKTLALALLAKAIEAGYSSGQHLSQDPDFMVLHGETEFSSLVGKIYQRPGAPTKSEYWIAHCEVTRGQFEEFIQDATYNFEKPTPFEGVDTKISPTADHPAQMVSWYAAVMYCNWLSRREGKSPVYRKTGKKEIGGFNNEEFDQWELIRSATGYRLLRDAEWEYAARAGSVTDWSSGSDEQLLADYCQTFPSKLSAEVGHKLPNAWGLHDMHGNVWEWCYDQAGSFRVSRGGSWLFQAAHCRSANRSRIVPSSRLDYYGFRVALSSSGIPK